MSEIETVTVGQIRQIFINRPNVGNSLSIAVLGEMAAALQQADADPAVRAVVLSGRGKLFCGGGDVKSWRASKTSAAAADEDGARFGKASKALIVLLANFAKPTIAMVNGAAAGAGLDLACACDFRFAATSAKFLCAYTRVGFSPDAGGTWLLPRLIGLTAAKELVYTGEIWTADRACEAGLVQKVVPGEQLEAETMAFGQKLASGPTIAIAQAKRLMHEGLEKDLGAQIDAEHEAARICRHTKDHLEGLAAATERRAPNFIGA